MENNEYVVKVQTSMYKHQLDKVIKDVCRSLDYPDYTFDRALIEMDHCLFKSKFMLKHNLDLDKIDNVKKDFEDRVIIINKLIAGAIYVLLLSEVSPEEKDRLKDVFIEDINIESYKYTIKVSLVCDTIENCIKFATILDCEDNTIFNINTKEYFRFYTDSYNDGIAKAFPELFENKADKAGVGSDNDIFVHNVTLQTSERCSLNCFTAGTKIMMADGTHKNIEDIVVGDMVMGISEDLCNKVYKYNEEHKGEDPRFMEYNIFNPFYDNRDNYIPSKVTNTFHNQASIVTIGHEYIEDRVLYSHQFEVTPDHPFLTINGEFKNILQIFEDRDSIVRFDGYKFRPVNAVNLTVSNIFCDQTRNVYNFETETHTYIANGYVVHNCTYCYQFNKTPARMDFETAKEFIDNLLEDKYSYVNRYNSPAIILEFIGGEPLLEIKLTRQIYEYFLMKAYKMDHPWFMLHRLSICSNGMQYFDKEVQDFFREYSSQISFNISIDGNKKLHDSCRIQPNGEGSYDICMKALNHYNKNYSKERNSKMTLAPNNIEYLFESVKDFIDNGMKSINLNCVFEEGWNEKTAREEYLQLIQLADYLIDNDLHNIYLSVFNERQEDVQDKLVDGSFCGGASASMLAVRPNGDFYPCIRYMPTAVNSNLKDMSMGNVKDGMIGRTENSDVIKELDENTRRSQSNDICYNCPIGNSCPNCGALGYSVYNDPKKRTTFHCSQKIAEACANVYYWNKLNLKHPEFRIPVRYNNVPKEWMEIFMEPDEIRKLYELEIDSVVESIGKNNLLKYLTELQRIYGTLEYTDVQLFAKSNKSFKSRIISREDIEHMIENIKSKLNIE